jgi:uncharacterized Ntn-hydrolase superfamily protein
MTYSIVARDAGGQLGVAVQTAMFNVGAVVPWARPGVGAVATQAFGEPAYGARCLDALESGASAADALAAAVAADPMPALRQVGVVSADGTVAAHTGELCIDHAGHLLGEAFSVQANMMRSPEVWPAMADDFRASDGPLARRLLSALRAAQAAGGDARGVMSAAIVVVEGTTPATPGSGTVIDLRVERSDDPLGELAELLDAADAFAAFERGVDELMAGDPTGALRTFDRGLELLPGEANLRFPRIGALAASGAVDDARAELRGLLADDPGWEVLLRSFADKGMIAMPPGMTIDELLT